MSAKKEILMKFITTQNEKVRKDVSMQGYKDNSPYRNNPFNFIYGTPDGTNITMKGVSVPVLGIDELGNKQQMMPGQDYFFPGSRVREEKLTMQSGGQSPYTVTMNNPFVIQPQGMLPTDYYQNLPKNEAGIPYDKDGTLFTQSKVVSRYDENGKPLSSAQIRENQKMWNMQKIAYSPEQQTFNLWKNNPQNTAQGYYSTKEYDKYLKSIVPKGKDVGLDGLCDPNFSSTKCGTSKQHAKEDKKEWSKKQEGGNTWKTQQEKVKAEKLAKLKALLSEPKPVFKKKTMDQLISEKMQQNNIRTVAKDNTATRGYNNASIHSNAARNKTDKEIADERKQIRQQSDANVLNSYSLEAFKPSNYTRENLSEMAKGLESKFRVSDEPNFFDDYLNPFNMIGGMASNLGQAPLQAKESDSYLPYVTSVGAPLILGAAAGLGTTNNAQFINNIVNPVAGADDLLKGIAAPKNILVDEHYMGSNAVNNAINDVKSTRLPSNVKLNELRDAVEHGEQWKYPDMNFAEEIARLKKSAKTEADIAYIDALEKQYDSSVSWHDAARNRANPVFLTGQSLEDMINPLFKNPEGDQWFAMQQFRHTAPKGKNFGYMADEADYIHASKYRLPGNRFDTESMMKDIGEDASIYFNERYKPLSPDFKNLPLNQKGGLVNFLQKAQEGKTVTLDYGDNIQKKILTDSREYSDLFNEKRIGVKNDDGSISVNPLDEVVITPYDKQYPFYQELSDEEKKYFNDDTPIGRAVRRKAYTKNSLSEDVTDIAAPVLYGTAAAMLAPYVLAPLAGGLEFAGAMAAPYVEGALATSLPGMSSIPGATVGNAINAGFAGHGLYNIAPDAAEMYNNPSWSNTGNVGMDALEIAPVAGPALKIIGEGAGTLKKGFNALNDFAKNKELLRLERQMQNYNNNRLNNLDIEEVRRAFHNSERFLTNEEIELLRRHGRGASENYTIPPPPPLENQSGMIGVSEADYTLEGALRRLHSGAPLEQEHINVLGDKYNTNQLSITDSNAFGRYIVANRGSLDLRRGAVRTPNNSQRIVHQLDDSFYNQPFDRNRSRFTRQQALEKANSQEEKQFLESLSDEDFAKTVTKPTGQTVAYVDGPSVSQMTYNPEHGKLIVTDAIPMTSEAYTDIFNSNINRLNEIIAKNNRTGVQYQVEKLYPNGQLKFVTPEQTVRVPNRSTPKATIKNLSSDPSAPYPYQVEYSKGPEHYDMAFFDTLEESQKFINDLHANNPTYTDLKIKPGSVQWETSINPAKWEGQVEDIANKEYFKSIPGLNMSISSNSPFADRVRREGSGAYKSINQFLKELNLGRVKPGFNSQTSSSFGVWDSYAKKGDAFGYYAEPNLFYGSMKKQGGNISFDEYYRQNVINPRNKS